MYVLAIMAINPIWYPGLQIRSIFGRIRLRILKIRILKLDPDPESYLHLKNQFKHLNFFHIKHISSDIWMMIIFIWKKWNNSPENLENLYFLNIFSLFMQLYITKIPIGSGSGENFADPDPTKKVRIRIQIRNPAFKLVFKIKVP